MSKYMEVESSGKQEHIILDPKSGLDVTENWGDSRRGFTLSVAWRVKLRMPLDLQTVKVGLVTVPCDLKHKVGVELNKLQFVPVNSLKL